MNSVKIILLTLLLSFAILCAGTEYYVSPDGSSTGSGTKNSPWSLSRANTSAKAGDTIILLNGRYGTSILPAHSGEKNNPIVFRAAAALKPVFTGMNVAITLKNRSYVTIQGITVKDVSRFLRAERSSHITIDRCHFENGKGWESCSLKYMGDYITLKNTVLKNGSDLFSIQGGSHHLIEGNTFDRAEHTCLVLMGVQRSVVRNNFLTNPIQKIMEVFSTRAREYKEPLRKSMYLLIENNRFDLAADLGETIESGIQYAGNRTILRCNIYRRCGIGMSFTNYAGRDWPEAIFSRNNRFYNNVIIDCGSKFQKRGVGLGLGRNELLDAGGQVVINNIIYRNPTGGLGGMSETVQVSIGGHPSIASLFYNNILFREPGKPVISVSSHGERKEYTLSEYERAFPEWTGNNIERKPLFTDPDNGEFTLKPDSPCIDAGGPLTLTPAGGKGTVIVVKDALFFSDGHGVVDPDIIRVGSQRVKIVSVDYEMNEITVNRPISWRARSPVTLDYKGYAPDMGAFEFPGKGDSGMDPGMRNASRRKVITILPGTFTAQGGGTATVDPDRPGVDNPIVTNWDRIGHWIEWTLRGVRKGKYEVMIKYATVMESPRKVYLNGRLVKDMGPFSSPGGLGSFTLTPTETWNTWTDGKLPAPLYLKRGKNILRMEVTGGYGLNLALITLKPVK